MKRVVASLILATIAFPLTSLFAQSQEKLYSLMLLNFAKGIHWPTEGQHEFVIGVYEYPPLVSELVASSANTRIHGRKIKVLDINDVNEAKNCEILFIPAYKARLLPKVTESVTNESILIVTNKINLVKTGSGIDLVLREGKLTFDINCKAIEARGLKISTSLRSTGNIVQ